MPDFSYDALVKFLEYAGEKGLMNPSTATGLRVAVSKIRDHLDEAEVADVRTIDIDAAFQKYVNLNPTDLSPGSLREYARRVTTAVTEFDKWANDKAGYKPRGRTRRTTDAKKGLQAASGNRSSAEKPARGGSSTKNEDTGNGAGGGLQPPDGLTLPFPIRSDFLVSITIPRDLKSDEARRLGAFISTLAIDYET